MLWLWLILGALDIFIIFFFILLCVISLRHKPNDIREHVFRSGSEFDRLQQEVFKKEPFFRNHRYTFLAIDSNGISLVAKRYSQKNPVGRIILFHGYRSIPETDFACAISTYFELGYELILVDQRAHGKSSGNWIGFGILERYDCLAWIQFLNQEYGEIPTFLSGISMGASTVLMAQGLSLPPNVKGIIADCGFTSPKEIVAHVMRKKLHLPSPLLLPILSGFSKVFAGYFFGEYSAIEAMKVAKLPTLFIHGKADNFVPTEMTLRNYEACTAEKELILVEGAGHGTSFLQDGPRVEKAIHKFLKKYNSI
jgi:alpha-beta hydrolase superfamily lysophospholipase